MSEDTPKKTDTSPIVAVAITPEPKKAAPRRPNPRAGRHPVSNQKFYDTDYKPFKDDTQLRLASTEQKLDAADTLLRQLSLRSMEGTLAKATVARLESEFASIKRRYDALAAVDTDDPIVATVTEGKKSALELKLSEFYTTLSGQIEALEDRVDDHEGRIVEVESISKSNVRQLGSHETMLLEHDEKLESITVPVTSKIPLLIGLLAGLVAFVFKFFIKVPDLTVHDGDRTIITALSLYNSFWGALVTGVFFGAIAYLIATAFSFGQKTEEYTGSSALKEKRQDDAADGFIKRHRKPKSDDDAKTEKLEVHDLKPGDSVEVEVHKKDDVDTVKDLFVTNDQSDTAPTHMTAEPVRA